MATLAREGGDNTAAQVDRAYRRAPRPTGLPTKSGEAIEFIGGQEGMIVERARARLPAGVPGELPPGVDPFHAARSPTSAWLCSARTSLFTGEVK